MTDRQFWMKLDHLSSRKEGWMMELIRLLRQAYEEDLNIIIGCHHDSPDDVRQLYISLDADIHSQNTRYLMCYTSKEAARSDPALAEPCEKVPIRSVIDNALDKPSIGGLVFNRHMPERMYAVNKQFLGDFEMVRKAFQRVFETASTDRHIFDDL